MPKLDTPQHDIYSCFADLYIALLLPAQRVDYFFAIVKRVARAHTSFDMSVTRWRHADAPPPRAMFAAPYTRCCRYDMIR